jgi:NAD(P)H dehydrogenase (quinone)
MKTLIVISHPRPASLTHDVAAAFAAALREGGAEVEVADLHAEGFDPLVGVDDEPDWDDPAKRYSDAVLAEMARIERNEATVLVFPVWWWSMPAMMKGWIDRVWNHGWAYGGRTYPHRKVWAIGIAGSARRTYDKYGYEAAMNVQIETGILRYCGVEHCRLALLYGAIEGEGAAVLAGARALGQEFAASGADPA